MSTQESAKRHQQDCAKTVENALKIALIQYELTMEKLPRNSIARRTLNAEIVKVKNLLPTVGEHRWATPRR